MVAALVVSPTYYTSLSMLEALYDTLDELSANYISLRLSGTVLKQLLMKAARIYLCLRKACAVDICLDICTCAE